MKPYREDRYDAFRTLREAYPRISYDSFSPVDQGDILAVTYRFSLGGEIHFAPSIELPRPSQGWHLPPSHPFVTRALFLLGMVELLSYWKLACSPSVCVAAGSLDQWECRWWSHLWRHGMGEFLYRNGVPEDERDLVSFTPQASVSTAPSQLFALRGNLIPVGGGKDSAVVLRLLESQRQNNHCLLVNPTPAAVAVVATAGYQGASAVCRRTLDPKLLQLNATGAFLNGHTPFSALLAFTSVLIAGLWGSEFVLLANESSANESTVPGSTVNHQYSKSLDFENRFRQYVRRSLTPSIHYLSLLRSLNEVRIGQMFAATAGPLEDVFCSCNVGGRQGLWCGTCEKCLFSYLMLAPFLPRPRMVRIFGSDLLQREDLLPGLERLVGLTPTKAFDCVGTVDEVRGVVRHLLLASKEPMPLLRKLEEAHPRALAGAPTLEALLASRAESNLPASFGPLLE
jgi:hypothetical protein